MPRGLLRATAIVATVGVVLALVGLVLLLRPVSTPAQDCGTTLGYLLDGRVDVFIDVDDLPPGVTKAEAKANAARPCRERVADAAKPAAIVLSTGLVIAIGASLVEVGVRGAGLVRRRRARRRGRS